MKTNKKGFTLIELLAVIVILAIIALITVPVVIKIIDNAKRGAAEDSTYGVLKSAQYYWALKNNDLSVANNEVTFTCNSSGVCSGTVQKSTTGTDGTITTLPTASSSNKGYTYKVITAGTYASQSAKVGDTFISDGTTWVLIPSGDEPSGTVTSVTIKATSPIAVNSSSAITTSGTRTISHEISGVTEGSYGDSSAQTPSFGGTFKVTSATVNATGKKYECHVTVEVPNPNERVIDPTKPIIALTFDDGPSIYTEGLLETLNSYGVTATFFMCNDNCGSNLIPKYADLIRAMYNSGNEIANHTMRHPQLTKCSSSKMEEEIGGNRDKIESVIGEQDTVLLRPPYGSYNDTVKSVCVTPIILWSIDTEDWKVKGQSNATDKIMELLKKEAKDGGIILMHDIHQTSCEAVKTVVPWLISQGYQVCSVSEMFEARGITLENGEVYSRCSVTAEQYNSQN